MEKIKNLILKFQISNIELDTLFLTLIIKI